VSPARVATLWLCALLAAFLAGIATPQASPAVAVPDAHADAKLAAGQGTCNVPYEVPPGATRTYACLTFVSGGAMWPLLQIKTGNTGVLASVVSTNPPPLLGGTFVLFNPTSTTQRGTAVVEVF
jgi:hypothetical protein